VTYNLSYARLFAIMYKNPALKPTKTFSKTKIILGLC